MKYLKEFDTHSEYEQYMGGKDDPTLDDLILSIEAGTYTGQDLIDAVEDAGVFDRGAWYFEMPSEFHGAYNIYTSGSTMEIYCPTYDQVLQYTEAADVSGRIRRATDSHDGCFIFTDTDIAGGSSVSDLSEPLEVTGSPIYGELVQNEHDVPLPNVSVCLGESHVHYALPRVQADNEIWYTTYDGMPIKEFSYYYNRFFGGADGDEGLDYVSNVYENGLGVLTLSDSITRIGGVSSYSAFDNCDNLESLTFPKSTKFISKAVMECDSHFIKVTIPENVVSINESAFDYCDALTTVEILAVTPPERTGGSSSLYDMFGNRTNPTHIRVPAQSVDLYKSAAILKKHWNNIEAL